MNETYGIYATYLSRINPIHDFKSMKQEKKFIRGLGLFDSTMTAPER